GWLGGHWFLAKYFGCCNYFMMSFARHLLAGGTFAFSEPARTSVRCKGGHSHEPVHRAGDEQVIYL
ncbi:hypothetical protein, partial [Citrobacter freundii]|uniref:hypothetical protein n=1 Tax=Citrobacter freundii TaxID=546 RepID=UPI001BCE4FF6